MNDFRKSSFDDDSHDPRLDDDALEPGLEAAFGPGAAPRSSSLSVLETISRVAGVEASVLLLDEDDDAGPLRDPAAAAKLELPAGRGNYRLLGEVARGGMGVVYKGHDSDLGRSVAMKILHEAHVKNPVILKRFVEEAQIGGQLQHPGIVPVYEMGLMADDRPYFTMKLVKGRTLAALLADRKQPGEDLHRFLSIFEQVCQTMAYAHSRGVIHRDLKPANFMVGAFGEVQIVDWGLAKVLGRSEDSAAGSRSASASIIETVRTGPAAQDSNSMTGSVMGTPAYMPPEQAQGDVEKLDERSDVFALGAILCELLTGRRPYEGEGSAVLRAAARGELEGARARLDECEADAALVALAKECLAPTQRDRPRNAGELVERLERYFESVQERRRTAELEAAEARVKAGEERKARKLTLALAASVLLTALVGGGAWYWNEQDSSERAARTSRAVHSTLNQASLMRGQGRFAEALALVRRAEGEASTGEADEALQASVTQLTREIGQEAEAAREEREEEERTRRFLERLAAIQIGDRIGDPSPRVQAQRAREYEEAFRQFGLEVEGVPAAEAAAAIRDSDLVVKIATALDDWARCERWAAGKPGPTRYEQDWELERAHRLTWIAMQADPHPWRGAFRRAVLSKDWEEFFALSRDERIRDCTPMALTNYLLVAMDLRTARVEVLPATREIWGEHMDSWHANAAMGITLLQEERWEEALRYLYAARALEPDSAVINYMIAQGACMLHDWDSAMHAAREADRIDPGTSSFVKRIQDQMEEAQASATGEPGVAPGGGDSKLPDEYQMHADVQMKTGDARGAVATLRTGVAAHPDWALGHFLLGSALRTTGEYPAALEAFEDALRLDPGHAESHFEMALVLNAMGREDEALEAFEQAVRDRPLDVGWRRQLGLQMVRQGDYDGVVRLYEEGLEAAPDQPVLRNNLAWHLVTRPDEANRDPAAAVGHARRALETSPKNPNYWNTLGVALYRAGEWKECQRALRRSMQLPEDLDLRAAAFSKVAGGSAYDFFFLAMASAQLGDPEAAQAWFRHGVAWREGQEPHNAELRDFQLEAEELLAAPARGD